VTIELKPWLRVGHVTPHPLNDTLPYEFHLMAPPGVMLMTAGLEIGDYTLEAVEQQLPVLDRRVESLMRRGASRIVISGVPVALALGQPRVRGLLGAISEKWQVPADTDLEAIVAAAKHLGIRRVGIATRWKTPMNERLAAYLDEAGVEVVAVANSGRSMEENAGLDDETGIRLAMDLGSQALNDPASPDGVIMPGGRWITIGAIRNLEEKFAKPVITNHSASLWAALRAANYREPIRDWGRLLSSLGD
jgi:maleate cis-trans isomerase